MKNIRQNKISSLVQRSLSEIFLAENSNLFDDAMISVTKVYVTRDLSLARIYISIYKTDNKDEVFKKVSENKSYIRKLLGLRIGKQIRFIPQLEFYIDDSLDYIENIEKLLKK